MADKRMLDITNRSASFVGYKISDTETWRTFQLRETKRVPYEEVEAAMNAPGGRELFANYLLIKDPGVAEDVMNTTVEKEYYMTEEEIISWIPTCSLDEFKDALDFAPEGVKDLIKQYSVSLPLIDMNKRQALLDQLGFNVTAAIKHDGEDKEDKPVAAAPTRRAPTQDGGRRVTIIKNEENK